MTPLEKELEGKLLDIYERCKTIGYTANYFKRMIVSKDPRYRKGPIGTVRHLMLGSVQPQSGFARLKKANRIDWTVEWLIANDPKWAQLSPKADWVIKKAKSRLQTTENSN